MKRTAHPLPPHLIEWRSRCLALLDAADGKASSRLVHLLRAHCELYAAINNPNDNDGHDPQPEEVAVKVAVLKLPASSAADHALKGRYLRLLGERDEWWADDGVIDALIAGMEAAL